MVNYTGFIVVAKHDPWLSHRGIEFLINAFPSPPNHLTLSMYVVIPIICLVSFSFVPFWY